MQVSSPPVAEEQSIVLSMYVCVCVIDQSVCELQRDWKNFITTGFLAMFLQRPRIFR